MFPLFRSQTVRVRPPAPMSAGQPKPEETADILMGALRVGLTNGYSQGSLAGSAREGFIANIATMTPIGEYEC